MKKSIEDKSIQKFVKVLQNWSSMSIEQRKKIAKEIITIMAKNLEKEKLKKLRESSY